MSKTERERKEMLMRLRKLADRRVNDAVKLAFLNADQVEQVDQLDLNGLVELKKTEKGFEARFVDQVKVLEMMRELMEQSNTEAAEEFFQALNGSTGGGDL